jgi:aminopeptidase N
MAPYQATVAVGPYVRVEDTSPGGVPLRHYMFEEDRADFEPYRVTIGEMVDWFSERLGPYPFEAFGYVLVDHLGGALETQTMVVLDRASLGESIMAHELAHMWFGDWVSLDSWREMWRSEGAANYFAGAWLRRSDPGQFADELAPGVEAGPQASFPLGDPPPSQLFSGPVYEQGALFFADLRRAMRDEAFFAGLQAYFARYSGGTAADAEFQAVMEAAAGQPLDDLFTRWLR